MADIGLYYRVPIMDDQVSALDIARKGLADLRSEVLDLIDATEFKNDLGEVIDVEIYLSEWDEWEESDGILTCSDNISISGGMSAYDAWESDGRQKSYGVAYAEELEQSDWMPFRDLVLSMNNDLGKGIYISLDHLSVTENWRNGGYWFNDYQFGPEIRTAEEIERDRISFEKRLEAQRIEALKIKSEKEERRKKREPLIQAYKTLEHRFSYAFNFVNPEHAITQGIRINPITPEAVRFLENLN
ncbi:MAG: hypothetical protein ACRC62_02200, partial [Microcoleus sp.]